MSESEVLWRSAPHTAAKHRILRGYMDAWLPILFAAFDKLVYIDACAGPGVYDGGEPGSPIIALKSAIEHRYIELGRSGKMLSAVFIESEKQRCDRLQQEVGRLPVQEGVRWQVRHGRFEDELLRCVRAETAAAPDHTPVLVFIDPFGHNIPIQLVRDLMGRPHREVLISLMQVSIRRFADLRPTEMDELLGTDEWRDYIGPDEDKHIRSLYIRQLRAYERIRWVKAFSLADAIHQPVLDLVFGTNDKKGLEKMLDVMWAVDPQYGCSFCDATDPNQLVLFAGPDEEQLQRLLLSKFKGLTVPVEAVELAAMEAGFRRAHVRRVALTPLKKESLIRVAGDQRGFPEGSLITFLGS